MSHTKEYIDGLINDHQPGTATIWLTFQSDVYDHQGLIDLSENLGGILEAISALHDCGWEGPELNGHDGPWRDFYMQKKTTVSQAYTDQQAAAQNYVLDFEYEDGAMEHGIA